MSAAPAGSPSLALRTPSSRWRPSPVLVRCRADAHQGLGATNGGGGGGDGVAAEIRDRSHHGGRQADPWPDGLGRMTISVAVCRTGVDRRPARRDSEFRYGASPIRVRRSFLRRGHQLAVRRGASRRNRRPVGDHVDVGSRRRPGPVNGGPVTSTYPAMSPTLSCAPRSSTSRCMPHPGQGWRPSLRLSPQFC